MSVWWWLGPSAGWCQHHRNSLRCQKNTPLSKQPNSRRAVRAALSSAALTPSLPPPLTPTSALSVCRAAHPRSVGRSGSVFRGPLRSVCAERSGRQWPPPDHSADITGLCPLREGARARSKGADRARGPIIGQVFSGSAGRHRLQVVSGRHTARSSQRGGGAEEAHRAVFPHQTHTVAERRSCRDAQTETAETERRGDAQTRRPPRSPCPEPVFSPSLTHTLSFYLSSLFPEVQLSEICCGCNLTVMSIFSMQC